MAAIRSRQDYWLTMGYAAILFSRKTPIWCPVPVGSQRTTRPRRLNPRSGPWGGKKMVMCELIGSRSAAWAPTPVSDMSINYNEQMQLRWPPANCSLRNAVTRPDIVCRCATRRSEVTTWLLLGWASLSVFCMDMCNSLKPSQLSKLLFPASAL